MRLVKEGGCDYTSHEVWLPVATHLSQELEPQDQNSIGLQEGDIQYSDKSGTHDHRKDHCWLLRRFWDAAMTSMKHQKQIIRVVVG